MHGDLGGSDPRLVATLKTLQELQAEGKIAHLMHGDSHQTDDAEALQHHHHHQNQPPHWQPSAVEMQYSVFRRDLDPVNAGMKDAGTVVIGIVQMDGFPETIPPLKSSHVLSIAARLHKSPAQVLTRWSAQSGIVSIPCTFSRQHLLENSPDVIGSFSLSDSDMELLDSMATMDTPPLKDNQKKGHRVYIPSSLHASEFF